MLSHRQVGMTVLVCASGFVGPFAIDVFDVHVRRSPSHDLRGRSNEQSSRLVSAA
jgi:hypothetical protein